MGTHSLRNFTQGEFSPLMLARQDLDQYHNGVSLLENFQILPQGGVERRPGTLFAGETRLIESERYVKFDNGDTQPSIGDTLEGFNSGATADVDDVTLKSGLWADDDAEGEIKLKNYNGKFTEEFVNNKTTGDFFVLKLRLVVRLIPFIYSQTQSYTLVFCDGYVRFYTNGGGQVESGGSPYEISHPYSDTALPDLRFVQSNDVLFMVHPDYKLRRLERRDHTDWTFVIPDLDKGPYLVENTDDAHTITPTDNADGTADLSASKDTFTSGNVGGLFKLKHTRTDNSINASPSSPSTYIDFTSGSREPSVGDTIKGSSSGATAEVFSKNITSGTWAGNDAAGEIYLNNVSGTFENETINNDTTSKTDILTCSGPQNVDGTSSETVTGKGEWKLITHGKWIGTLQLWRSFDGGNTWQVYRSYSSDEDNNVLDTGIEDSEATFRLVVESYYASSTDAIEYSFTIFDYYTESVIRITNVTDAQNAKGNILEPDSNVLKSDADGNSTAIWAEGAWSDRRGWPSTICFFEQRLLMAGTSHRPQTIWGSKIDRYEDFEIGTNDDDPYAYAFDSDRRNPITWLLPGKSLLVGTEGGIWRFGGGSNFRDPITPTNVLARREVVEGTNDAFAMQDRVLFVGRERKSLTELSYNYANDQYVPNDMSILAPHILQGQVKEFAFTSEPYDTAWFLPDSGGDLKSFTREPQHKISGWGNHKFDQSKTFGTIKSVAAIPGSYGDELFVAVNRLIDGKSPKTRQYIELIQPHHWEGDVDYAVHLDSSLEYHKSSAAKTFSGLDHLEGEEISVWVDGATHPKVWVENGEITLDYEAYDVIAGVNYTSSIKTMPLPFTPDKKGRTPQVVVDLYKTILGYIRTVGIKNYVAPDEGELETLVTRQVLGFMNSGIDTFTGPLERQIEAQLDRRIEVEVMQSDPAPLTLLALHLENVVLE